MNFSFALSCVDGYAYSPCVGIDEWIDDIIHLHKRYTNGPDSRRMTANRKPFPSLRPDGKLGGSSPFSFFVPLIIVTSTICR